ncbi:hypothetical protein GDO78_006764 [Eleutherodactylus coqui]|uniref:Uncharacterized protein n=1 Tax=Eleutherodactylus coqui TaxID=57060 RepID=A0A8J6FH69_ELECQ|nr:hypothetical protein GDO78_006764 [Eleutherodactylus coqui]
MSSFKSYRYWVGGVVCGNTVLGPIHTPVFVSRTQKGSKLQTRCKSCYSTFSVGSTPGYGYRWCCRLLSRILLSESGLLLNLPKLTAAKDWPKWNILSYYIPLIFSVFLNFRVKK